MSGGARRSAPDRPARRLRWEPCAPPSGQDLGPGRSRPYCPPAPGVPHRPPALYFAAAGPGPALGPATRTRGWSGSGARDATQSLPARTPGRSSSGDSPSGRSSRSIPAPGRRVERSAGSRGRRAGPGHRRRRRAAHRTAPCPRRERRTPPKASLTPRPCARSPRRPRRPPALPRPYPRLLQHHWYQQGLWRGANRSGRRRTFLVAASLSTRQ